MNDNEKNEMVSQQAEQASSNSPISGATNSEAAGSKVDGLPPIHRMAECIRCGGRGAVPVNMAPDEADTILESKTAAEIRAFHDVAVGVFNDVTTKHEEEIYDNDAINWGDFQVVSVEWCQMWDGRYWDYGWRILIEEADPGCSTLHKYMYEHLKELGYEKVEVVTEW